MRTRRDLQRLALNCTNQQYFDSAMDAMYRRGDMSSQQLYIALQQWGLAGAQSVQMPETFTAALMATDCGHALEDDDKLPWPAFEIMIPPKLLATDTGGIYSVIVTTVPEWARGGHPERLLVVYLDDSGCAGTSTFGTLREMISVGNEKASDYHMADELVGHVDEDQEKRVWMMLGRLIGGVLLLIYQARTEKKGAYAPQPRRTKRDQIKPNVFQLGKPLKLDCRLAIREFVAGGGRGSPNVTTWVRGHMKNVVQGKGRANRVLRWIQPYQRGEGPMLVRPVKLKPDDDLEGLFGDWLPEGS